MQGMIILLILVSCKRSNITLNVSFSIPEMGLTGIDSCMNPVLHEGIGSYLRRYESDPGSNYYSVYFFRKDTIDYFTIWRHMLPPVNIKRNNPGVALNYYWFLFNNEDDVVLITRQDDHRPMLFKPCINQLDDVKIKIEDLPWKDRNITGSSVLARTYRYYFQDGKYHVEELRDTIFTEILGEGCINNEMRLLKKENEIMKRSKPVKDDRPESRENTRKN